MALHILILNWGCKMTRKEIRDLIRKNLGETTPSFWTDAELNIWINDAGEDIAFRAKCIKANSYMTVVEDTAEYTLSTNFADYNSILKVYLFTNSKTWLQLTSKDRDELERDNRGWMSVDSATPTNYYWDVEEDMIGLYTPPNSDNSGENYLRVYYTKDFTDLTIDSQAPGIPKYLHMGIVYFVTSFGSAQRGWGDKANDWIQKYEDRLHKYKVERTRERTDDTIQSIPERNAR